jgi:uncharacterized membrane protein
MSLVLIRLLHVLLGIFWAGSVLVSMLYLQPATEEAGPAGGEVMQQLQKRGFLGASLLAGLFAVLTGGYVLWKVSGGFDPSYMGSLRGIMLSTGGLTGLLALAVGAHVSRPTARKLGVVAERVAAAAGNPDPEDVVMMTRLRRRGTVALRIAGVLVVITLVTMTYGAHGS